MEYTITKKVNKSFNDTINAVTVSLKQEGFGLITEVDLKEKFKDKLGIEFRNYRILGACNPAMAFRAIQQEDRIGVMLPCNVLVQEKENGEVEVAAINPLSSIGVVDNPSLREIAGEVTVKLKAAIERL